MGYAFCILVGFIMNIGKPFCRPSETQTFVSCVSLLSASVSLSMSLTLDIAFEVHLSWYRKEKFKVALSRVYAKGPGRG
jgi:hypothetical protein